MDTLFWKNLQSESDGHEISIFNASKIYYKQYFYKLELDAPGCRSIKCADISYDIETRRTHARAYNSGGSWWDVKIRRNLAKADLGWLYHLQGLISEYPDVKIRIEDPKLSIYATDELMIQSFARAIDPDNWHNIISITGPKDLEIQKLLSNNAIIVKRKPEFSYRVFFKEKQYSHQTRYQIYNYLNELGDIVKMTPHTKDSLTKPHDWIWGCYFWTNDLGIAEFVRMINPDIIREVSELVFMDNK